MSLQMLNKEKKYEYLEIVLENEFESHMESLFSQLKSEQNNIVAEFKQTVNSLFKKCYEKQMLGEKGKVEIFHICYLLSSCKTRQYSIEMFLYDSNFYFDLNTVSQIWTPEFVFKYYEQEMKTYEKQAYNNIINFGYSDMEEIRLEYYNMYYGVLWTVLNDLIPFVRETEYFNKVEKTDKFCITFSQYMIPGWKFEFEV